MIKYSLILTFLFFSSLSLSYETWLHRAHEASSKEFSYGVECTKMPLDKVQGYFDFKFLKNSSFKGIELDVIFRKDIGDLVLFHPSKQIKDGHKYFQCFDSQYVTFSDFLKTLRTKYPALMIWIDLKNDDYSGIEKAAEKMKSLKNVLVETQSYIGLMYLSSRKIDTSLWLTLRGPIEKGVAGQIRMIKNKMRVWFAKKMGAKYISQSCSKLIEFKSILNSTFPKLCWGSAGGDGIKGLKVHLIGKIQN